VARQRDGDASISDRGPRPRLAGERLARPRRLRLPKPWVQLGRGLAVGTATATFFLSLRIMPLADATAIVFTSPIWTLILSFLFLRERPKPAVLVSIVLATFGVLLILRPNVLAFGWEALLPLVAALAMACLFILNRRVGGLARSSSCSSWSR
jgi:drug/metabolite transporter (DMT)-like permease